MRLTCPNCAAAYDIADGMVPAAGRHVQCTVCHTRWFVTGPPRPALSEEQILRRLETRTPHPRPVAVAEPVEAEPVEAEPSPVEPAAAEAPPAEAAPPVAAAAAPPIELEPEPEPRPEPESGPDSGAEPEFTPPPAEVPAPPPRQVDPAKPGERPTLGRPAPLSEFAAPPPRAALRLELVGETAALPEPPARSRFGSGLLLVLLLAALALAAYRYRAPIAAEVPAAAAALNAYGATVDDLRAEVEAQLAPLRRAVSGAGEGN